MYELRIRDYCFIAHSLRDKYFGPAENLHGATYIVDLILTSSSLNNKNVIMDIGKATDMLKSIISKYNYKNLDEIADLKDILTTTEFMAKKITEDIYDYLIKNNEPIDKLKSIKIILKENHLASASYNKNL